MIEAIKITVFATTLLLVPAILSKDIFWIIFWVGVASVLSLVEYLSYRFSGKTLSARFSNISFKNKILIIVGIGLFYIYLIGHLFFKW